MSVVDLARPEIRALEPYSSARMEAGSGAVMLNANESPWAPPIAAGAGLNRYPEPQPRALIDALAANFGVDVGQTLVARGSDEAIDLMLRVFCRAGRDAVVVCPPTFGMYRVAAEIHGVAVKTAALARPGFTLDAAAVLAACDATTRIVFVCSPNNPSGGLVPLDAIAQLADALRDRALLVVDEAYVEFAAAASAATLLARFDNLVVLRTLSKAWALAGARVGALLASRAVVELCRRVLAPYPLPTPSIAAARATLADPAAMRARVAITVRERERLAAALAARDDVLAVLPSAANFLCVKFREPEAVLRRLAARGVVVRDVSRYPGLAGCLRISVGLGDENTALLRALDATAEAA